MSFAQLSRFPQKYRARFEALAAISPRLAQLSESHPFLFCGLATGYGCAQARNAAVRAVEIGRPLREVCAIMEVPHALRRVPPEALPGSLISATVSEQAGQILALRTRGKHPDRAPGQTLQAAFYGARLAGEPFGLWLSEPRHIDAVPLRSLELVRALALYAWTSGRPGVVPPETAARPFTPAMSWNSAIAQASLWLDGLRFYYHFGKAPIADPWAEGGEAGGYTIVPLATFTDLMD